MTREQAENILEAYVSMEVSGGDNKARQSLREVILDAMTTTSYYPYITTSPTTIPYDNNSPWHVKYETVRTVADR